MNAILSLEISIDGGTNWAAGTFSNGRAQCGTTAGRYGSLACMAAAEAVTPTGAIHVRLSVNVNATGGALDASQFHVTVL